MSPDRPCTGEPRGLQLALRNLQANAADRVRTVSTVWLGSTLACAECHDHKFDPFAQKDFYQMAAFFADVEEEILVAKHNLHESGLFDDDHLVRMFDTHPEIDFGINTMTT